jgi:hypothetical protein
MAGSAGTKVIFLHVPKTAGQSVHAFLEGFFQPSEICPARENFQLLPYSVPELQKFRLFSGHLDRTLLDVVGTPRFEFTILRQPSERILSFYFFLRHKASKFDRKTLQLPEHQGLRNALKMTPDEYFCDAAGQFRTFIENMYDNFYTYYFAGRTFDARNKLRSVMRRKNSAINEVRLVEMAIANLKSLDRVYTTENLEKLEIDIKQLLGPGRAGVNLTELRVNAGSGDYQARMAELRALGASDKTIQRLNDMTRLDQAIWKAFS